MPRGMKSLSPVQGITEDHGGHHLWAATKRMCQLTVNWAFMLLSAERAMMIYDDLWCRCRFDWSYWLEIGAMSILVICAPWCKEVAKLGVCMHSCPYVSIIYLHNYTDSGIPDDGHSTSLLRNTNKIGLRGQVMWHAIWVCLRIGSICAQRKIYT